MTHPNLFHLKTQLIMKDTAGFSISLFSHMNWRCQLMQADLYNGGKTIVSVVVVSLWLFQHKHHAFNALNLAADMHSIKEPTSISVVILKVNIGCLKVLSFLSPLVLEQHLWGEWHRFLQAKCPSCHPTNSVMH